MLNKGILETADKNLNRTSYYYPIVRIIRENQFHMPLDYFPLENEHENIKIYNGTTLVKEISSQAIQNALNIMLNKILDGSKTFQIPELNDFFGEMQITKLKADSQHKKDIEIEINSYNLGAFVRWGFSIKSYLGAKPTLINAGKGQILYMKLSIVMMKLCIKQMT